MADHRHGPLLARKCPKRGISALCVRSRGILERQVRRHDVVAVGAKGVRERRPARRAVPLAVDQAKRRDAATLPPSAGHASAMRLAGADLQGAYAMPLAGADLQGARAMPLAGADLQGARAMRLAGADRPSAR
jgi:hypothetical protein